MDIATTYHEQLNIRLNNPSDSLSRTSSNPRTEAEIPVFREKPEEPKGIMDLKQMTDFLFMLMGSKIRIEPDLKNTGDQVNRFA